MAAEKGACRKRKWSKTGRLYASVAKVSFGLNELARRTSYIQSAKLHDQRRRSHRIFFGGDKKEDWGSGRRSPPEAEAFFVKLHIIFALKYNKQQLLSLSPTS